MHKLFAYLLAAPRVFKNALSDQLILSEYVPLTVMLCSHCQVHIEMELGDAAVAYQNGKPTGLAVPQSPGATMICTKCDVCAINEYHT